MKQNTEMIIIGGGIMGLSCAWRLAQSGHQVTVLEKGKCGSGSTCASLGALVPYNPWREEAHPILQRQSLWAYPAFAAELLAETGIDVAYAQCGRIQVVQRESQYQRLKDGCDIANAQWPKFASHQPQRMLTPEEVKRLEPELEGTEWGALYCRNSSKMDPVRMIAALRAACMKHGVDIRENSAVDRIIMDGGKVIGVICGTGNIATEQVVLAAGAWSKDLIPAEYRPKEFVKPLKGQSLELSVNKPLLRHMVRGRGIFIMQASDKRIWVGGTKEVDTGFDESCTQEAEDKLLQKAEALVPALAEAKVVKQWVGFRPHSEVGAPLVGAVENTQGLFSVTGHGGIGLCLAPMTAKLVAEEFKN